MLRCAGELKTGVVHERERMPVGRAIAQAVSRRLPTAAARVRSQVRSCGICGGQSGTGADFLNVLRLPLPIFIPPAASTLIIYRPGLVQ
jgi:hypothetical protein